MWAPKSGKSAQPPADGPAGGFAHFFYQKSAMGWGECPELPEKLVKTGGTPFLSTFWLFWAKVAQTGEFPGLFGVQGIEEKRNLPSGGELRGHLEVEFGHQRHSTYKTDPPGGR